MDESSSKRTNFFERMLNRLTGDTPDTPEEVLEVLQDAAKRQVLPADTLALLENVLDFDEEEVRDVMITRSQMDVIKINDSIDRIVAYVMETAHSRFPVIGEDKDEVLGIVHAKDLLRYLAQPEQFQLKSLLRPAVFIPESKSLKKLLRDFRANKTHMAIVIDEYGGVSGLVTFEDVLEQIIGDIEDEFDLDDTNEQIFAINPERFRVEATTEIGDFNEYFGTSLDDEEADTIGGLVVQAFGHLPERGEKIALGNFQFTVARADNRRVHTLMVTPTKA
jgi:magnesium and cobalt transporter